MSITRECDTPKQTASELLLGLNGLAAYIYILQPVYDIVFKSSPLKENKKNDENALFSLKKSLSYPVLCLFYR